MLIALISAAVVALRLGEFSGTVAISASAMEAMQALLIEWTVKSRMPGAGA